MVVKRCGDAVMQGSGPGRAVTALYSAALPARAGRVFLSCAGALQRLQLTPSAIKETAMEPKPGSISGSQASMGWSASICRSKARSRL